MFVWVRDVDVSREKMDGDTAIYKITNFTTGTSIHQVTLPLEKRNSPISGLLSEAEKTSPMLKSSRF